MPSLVPTLLAIVALGAAPALAPAQDEAPIRRATEDELASRSAFVETLLDRDEYFLREEVRVRVRFGVRTEFVESNLIQMFRSELDLPVQLDVPWLGGFDDAPVIASSLDDDAGISFALEHGIARAREVEVERAGGPWRALEVELFLAPKSAETLVLDGPTLRFAYGTEFREDFVNGRVAEDRIDAEVHGETRSLSIASPPESGRPPEYTDAIGAFEVAAEASPRDVVFGDTIKLSVRVTGDGNVSTFTPPRLDVPGFRVYGQLDTVERAGEDLSRILTVDISPAEAGTRAVPSVTFVAFDPTRAEYVRHETRPIPILVRPRPLEATKADGGSREASTRPESGTGEAADDEGASTAVLVAVGIGALVVAGIVVARRRG